MWVRLTPHLLDADHRPLGTLLAVPLTLSVKAILIDADPTVQWLRPLLCDQPNNTPATSSPTGYGGRRATEPGTHRQLSRAWVRHR